MRYPLNTELVPCITLERMHITELQLIRSHQHILGRQVAAADHHLGGAEIYLLDCKMQQRLVLLHKTAPQGRR